MSSWIIVDAEHRHAEFPQTFAIPDREIRNNLNVGSIVKIIVELKDADKQTSDTEAERIWVQVMEVSKNGEYTGSVDSDPIVITDIHADDYIKFSANNVIAVWAD